MDTRDQPNIKTVLLISFGFAFLVAAPLVAALVFLNTAQSDLEEDYCFDGMTSIAVATERVPAGEPLQPEHVRFMDVPQRFLPSGHILERDVEIYFGHPVSQDLGAEEMILTLHFITCDQLC